MPVMGLPMTGAGGLGFAGGAAGVELTPPILALAADELIGS